MKPSTHQLIKQYYHKFTRRPRYLGISYWDWQKRLRGAFGDESLDLRWNILDHNWQVWYESSPPYIVLTNEANCEAISKIIHLLKERQQTKKQMAEMWEKQLARQKKEEDDKIADVSGPMADALRSWSVGKVTSCVV